MTPIRARRLVFMGAALAVGGLAVELAHARPQNPPAGPICRVVWTDEGVGGGDTRTEHAEFTLPKYTPAANGSFEVYASAKGSVTYHSGTGCPVTQGSPWTEPFDLVFTSDDGKTGKIKVTPSDDSHSITVACGRGAATFDVEARSVPTSNPFPLKDEVKTDYSTSRSTGTVTLSYCKK